VSVYVDGLVNGPAVFGRRASRQWCHMIADTLDKLHAMAARIGLRRAWFQDARSGPHYDLTPTRRSAAVAAGAAELDRRAFVEVLRRVRGAREARG